MLQVLKNVQGGKWSGEDTILNIGLEYLRFSHFPVLHLCLGLRGASITSLNPAWVDCQPICSHSFPNLPTRLDRVEDVHRLSWDIAKRHVGSNLISLVASDHCCTRARSDGISLTSLPRLLQSCDLSRMNKLHCH